MPENILTDSIEGNLLKGDDLLTWTSQRFEEFFVFLDFFYVDGKMSIQTDTVRMLEEYSRSGAACSEFMSRIGITASMLEDEPKLKPKFRLRLSSMLLTVKRYLTKTNPGALSPITAKRCRFKMQYQWMREFYNDEGAVRYKPQVNTTDIVSRETPLVEDAPLVSRMQRAVEGVVSIYEAIASSITKEEINRLPLKDKLSALNKLSYIHAATGKMKTPVRFTQINIKSAGKEELEKQLLGLGEDDDES